ncbi:type III secretion system chaperone [Telmatospirillum sp. J64-1]|uniref:type III secretion system chaperone n=1 Tax=Telmatospirillum sp. J64-1 TaxID=2502183 RepID=UPI00115F1AF2|nr:type III secretion system chaperone [Telmatospirillum sp. J64-1]
MTARNLLLELGQRLNLGQIEIDPDGTCLLVFDKDLEVEMLADDAKGRLMMMSWVGYAPHEDREALFRDLLSANLLGRGTGAAVLGFDHLRDMVTLHRDLPATTEIEQAVGALEAFVNYLQAWRTHLTELASAAPETAQADTAMPFGLRA